MRTTCSWCDDVHKTPEAAAGCGKGRVVWVCDHCQYPDGSPGRHASALEADECRTRSAFSAARRYGVAPAVIARMMARMELFGGFGPFAGLPYVEALEARERDRAVSALASMDHFRSEIQTRSRGAAPSVARDR